MARESVSQSVNYITKWIKYKCYIQRKQATGSSSLPSPRGDVLPLYLFFLITSSPQRLL